MRLTTWVGTCRRRSFYLTSKSAATTGCQDYLPLARTGTNIISTTQVRTVNLWGTFTSIYSLGRLVTRVSTRLSSYLRSLALNLRPIALASRPLYRRVPVTPSYSFWIFSCQMLDKCRHPPSVLARLLWPAQTRPVHVLCHLHLSRLSMRVFANGHV